MPWQLYAYYKVATTAVTPQSANISRPGMFDFQGRAKYDAWVKHGSELEKAHHGKSTPELATLAKARYIEIAKDKFQFDEGQAQVLENAVQAAPQREKTADELLDEDEEESPPHPSASTGGMSVSTMSMGHGHQPNPDGAHECVIPSQAYLLSLLMLFVTDCMT